MEINFHECYDSGPNHVTTDECNITLTNDQAPVFDPEKLEEIDGFEVVVRLNQEGIIFDIIDKENGVIIASTYDFWNDVTDRLNDQLGAALAARVSKLYHVHNEFMSLAYTEGENLKFPDDYTFVGTVRTASLEKVFELANSIDDGWWNNPECELVGHAAETGGARSLSVGDVVFLPDGTFHRCMPTGWAEIKVEQPDPVCTCGKTSDGVCPRCGQDMAWKK